MILTTSLAVVVPVAAVFSLFLLFTGHNAPGGGFVGGLVAGAALVLRFTEGGVDAVGGRHPALPSTLLAAGVGLAAVTGVVPFLAGDALLESAILQVELPLVGDIKATSALPFDVGVYAVVVGVVLTILHSLGGAEGR
jgi:multicomponent Na+:H+ antiporter subunit A